MCLSCATHYKTNLQSVLQNESSFKAIRDFNIAHFPQDGYGRYYHLLQNGIAVLSSPEQLNTYMACYSDMHTAKLEVALEVLFQQLELHHQSIEVFDWGSGQALASCVLIDFLLNRDFSNLPVGFTLIDPSYQALDRGLSHLELIMPKAQFYTARTITKKLDELDAGDLCFERATIKLHLFSNILDIVSIDLDRLAAYIQTNLSGIHYFVCVSPIGEYRLEKFYSSFPQAILLSKRNNPLACETFRPSQMRKINKVIQRIEYIFKTAA